MDITLVINPGSSSKKYALFKGDKEILSVFFEHTEDGYGKCVEINGERQRCEESSLSLYEHALDEVIRIAKSEGVITHEHAIATVGIRVVSPGTYFEKHRIIDADYLTYLRAMEPAAPLHIPHTVRELNVLSRLLPGSRIVGVSDSAFHSRMPAYARRYSLPRKDTEALDIYRFGYHGISMSSVIRQVQAHLGQVPERTVVCHVGSGVSVTALKAGISVETTMGFAPGSGLMMGTRAGDVDSGALLYLMKVKGLSASEAESYVSSEGGLRGVLGQSDLRIALDRMARGDVFANEAVRMFMYNVKKSIGASAAVLGGVDLLVLTATAVERNPLMRALVCDGLEYLGVLFDQKANDALAGRAGIVSAEGSRSMVLVVHTNEMLEIARVAHAIHSV